MIQIRGISLSYDGVRVLDEVSCDLPDRGVIALMGSSGAGKSSLLKIVSGIVQPESGTVNGLHDKRVCIMFQEDRLLPWRSALKNVLLAMPKKDEDAAREILSRLLISNTEALPHELSGGMKRRVALARAIAFSPEVLLMDEPFSGIDEKTKQTIAPFVQKAAPLIFFATHDLREAKLLGANSLLILENGRLMQG